MCDNINSNPFAGLFPTINDAISFSSQSQIITTNSNDEKHVAKHSSKTKSEERDIEETKKDDPYQSEQYINKVIENVFGIALNKNDVATTKPLVLIDSDSIEHGLFERLILPDPKSKLINDECSNGKSLDSHIVETQIVPYLFECFYRLSQYKTNVKLKNAITDLELFILRNVATGLQEPELFQGQEIHKQIVRLFTINLNNASHISSFISGIVNELVSQNEDSANTVITVTFSPILDVIYGEAKQSTHLIFREYWFTILKIFSNTEPLAKLLIQHSTPKMNQGLGFAETLIGALLSLSCLPKRPNSLYDFFEKPLQQSSAPIQSNIWTNLELLNESMFNVFHSLVRCSSEVRHMTLQWISNCLHMNANRGTLLNEHDDLGMDMLFCVSDGFMLNLGYILLRLCEPFCIKPNDTKVPKIDPTYCAAEAKDENESKLRGLHMKGMTKETCLIPVSEGQTRPVAKSYGFVTECFFLTHRALDLGYRVALHKLLRITRDLATFQRAYNDSQTGGNSHVLEVIMERMDLEMKKYLSLRTSLLVPGMLKLLTKFHATTAYWLIQVIVHDFDANDTEIVDYTPKNYIPLTFPLPETVPDTLRCIPEFVVENTIGFLCSSSRLENNPLENLGLFYLNPILTEIIVLMESQRRLYNPHLRARLAEGLEALLPRTVDGNSVVSPDVGTSNRHQLFVTNPHREHIVTNLLQVFVSIEMTGQSVQFEHKFNYRMPMYVVMDYLWKIPEHRNNFIALASEAEQNMETVQPPLFLRFINLLMNDAVYMLDEALSNMAQLKQMLEARENGDWNKLPQQERDQQAGYLQHIGRVARFDNILGRETIHTMQMLTTEIKSIFCHPTMVDRIASMLNYLLLQLVGPNKKNFKVKDQKEYNFDPANLVLNISKIYINLSGSETFTLAVSQDGRSYSPEIFKLADNVLVRIGGVDILNDLNQFAKKVEVAAILKREEDEILNEAPEEFLDPIMSTLMKDPVILPSSRITIDRQTIARHLLSDQTDPFNRSPLTMDMVKSDTELREKIENWISEKKGESASTSSQ